MKKILTTFFLLTLLIVQIKAQSNYTGAGIALALDGSTGSYVDMGDVFNTLSFPFSFEAWVNPREYLISLSPLFSSDNDLIADYGVLIGITSTGALQIEFGDGLGSGDQFRRGYVTISTISLNRWTHLTVVCKSVTDVSFYFNGVLKTANPTAGTSASTVMIHSAEPAFIGGAINASGESLFTGQLDEVRLWHTARTETQVRRYMCKKVNPASPGLSGYWTSDESYISTTVNDQTTTAENGTLMGSVNKVTSGAPIGDAAKHLYTSDWFEVEVVMFAPSGERFKTQDISGDGIHVYRVDVPPYLSAGLTTSPSYYFGVFCIDGAELAGYNYRYRYITSTGIVNTDNEGLLELMNRGDASQNTWINVNGTLDTVRDWITKHDGLSQRGEYTINLPDEGKHAGQNTSLQTNDDNIRIYPNPTADVINIQLSNPEEIISSIRISTMTGIVLQEIKETGSGQKNSADVSQLANGIYLAEVETSSGRKFVKFEVQK